MQYPAHSLLYTLNKQRWLVWANFIGGIVTVIFAVALVPFLGLRGVVLGTALEMSVFYLFIMPWLMRDCAKLNPWRYLFGMILQPMAVSLALPALYAWWASPAFPVQRRLHIGLCPHRSLGGTGCPDAAIFVAVFQGSVF
jgi:O-antigen/teichoic acid export membrane protein